MPLDIHGVTIDDSITKLFIAGILPGLTLALLFMGYVAAWYFVRRGQRPDPEPPMSKWIDRCSPPRTGEKSGLARHTADRRIVQRSGSSG